MLGISVTACGTVPGSDFCGTVGRSVSVVAMFGAHGVSASVEHCKLDAAWGEHMLVSFSLGLEGCCDKS